MKIRRYRKYLLEVHGIQKDFFLDALTSMFEKNSGKTLRYLMVFFRVGSRGASVVLFLKIRKHFRYSEKHRLEHNSEYSPLSSTNQALEIQLNSIFFFLMRNLPLKIQNLDVLEFPFPTFIPSNMFLFPSLP